MFLVLLRAAALAGAVSLAALAYNLPVDTAGPLTVRIHEPALGAYGAGGMLQLTSPDLAIPILISLRNGGATAVRGALRLGLIDGWTAVPAGPVAFVLDPKAESELRFTVKAAPGSYNAHYPVHAYAEFDNGGEKLVAHPVLILETRYPAPPRSYLPLEWKPVRVAPDSALALERLPFHRDSLSVSSGTRLAAGGSRQPFETTEPIEFAGASIRMRLGPRSPSNRELVESAAVEFPLLLPSAVPLRFTAACAGPATFRLIVSGSTLATSGGPTLEADLSRFAGQSILLKLEAASETAGLAEWRSPTVVAGQAPRRAGATPRSLGKAGDYEVRVSPGNRGLLDATIEFSNGSRRLSFTGFRVQVLGDALEDPRGAGALTSVVEEAHRVRHHFESWAGSFDLLGELRLADGALRARWWLENAPPARPWLAPRIEAVRTGPWSDTAVRVYAGPGNVIERPEAFRLPFDGHNLATSFAGFDFAGGVSLVQAVDVTPDRLEVDPATRTYTLSTPHAQTVSFIPAPTVWDGVKIWRGQNPLQPSSGVGALAGRFVFDLWDWNRGYRDSADLLRRAFRYGLTNAVVVWHDWQRWGYDYRLPDIYPPNPQAGSVEDFRGLAEACRNAGVLFAPHDNYIDFYPDAEGFTYRDIVFRDDGSPYRAWFHAERQAQSYRFRPDRLQPFVERNLRLEKDSFHPTAYFIDVWSSIAPYDYWTSEGAFHERAETRRAWGETFAWIRDFLGGAPQISEAGHDQSIGWVDGTQAQILRVDPRGEAFTWRIRAADSERVPWFDAAHHDRIVLHGAGYPDRYAGGLDPREHGISSDDYITAEVLTGHPAMVADPFSRDVVRKYWLLDGLMRALALARIAGFEFPDGSLHRQHVTWENGAEVYVNRGAGDWTAAGHTLPQYGFYAKQGEVEAAIERAGAGSVEWARSPAALYVNARGVTATAAGITTDGGLRLQAAAGALLLTPLPASGRFRVRIDTAALPWKVAPPRGAEALDDKGAVLKRLALDRDGLTCEPGVFQYRLASGEAP